MKVMEGREGIRKEEKEWREIWVARKKGCEEYKRKNKIEEKERGERDYLEVIKKKGILESKGKKWR